MKETKHKGVIGEEQEKLDGGLIGLITAVSILLTPVLWVVLVIISLLISFQISILDFLEDIISDNLLIVALLVFIITILALFHFINKGIKKGKKEQIRKILKSIAKPLIVVDIVIMFYAFIWPNIKSTIDKPILYLYPTEETEVTIEFEHPEYIKSSYPKYITSWKVTATPDGDITYNGRYYYALYWDELTTHEVDFQTGFYVEADDAIDFLEEKLDIIGLTEREANEFIMYWLPILEDNGKSLVYFELTEERESYNKLIITPTPDSMLRVAIHVKKVNSKVNIEEEELTTFERVGFTVVEWGGVNYN